MPNTTWNPSDLNNVTLSGGNLAATVGSGVGGGRGIDSLLVGKYYLEYAYTVLNSNSIACGLSLSTGNLTSPAAGVIFINRLLGGITVSGVSSGSALGQIAPGTIIGMAVDFTNRLLWMRNAPAGSWNGSGADPVGGTGGVSFSVISGALFPYMSGQSGDRITANFGDSGFNGALPSGFTAGFPAPTVSVSGGPRMAFTASTAYGSITTGPLPLMVDVSGNCPAQCTFSHMRVVGAGAVTFNTGQVVGATTGTETVSAIPMGATSIIVGGGTPVVQLGQAL